MNALSGVLLALCAVLVAPGWGQPVRSATEQARDAVAAASDLGESAPDWLVDSETYAIGYDPNAWEALASSKVAFITHCPVNREFFARVHALGIRAFPYVTFYQGNADRSYEDLNLKDHPEFIEVDSEGNLKRTGFWTSEDAKNMYTTCPNVAGYQDAMVAWVRKIMELGADGVFVDNLGTRQECYGPKFGRHEHLYEDQNHAFAMLLGRVREVIKEYKPDGAVLGNSASPLGLPREYWKYLDAEMLESYICTWVSTERWFDWRDHWHRQGVELQPFVRAGKQIQALSYLGHTPYGVREDAFFCYASARLAGFVWNGGVSLSDPEQAVLHQIRLGPALGEEQEEDGVFYRVFERGLVAVNPDREKAGEITIREPIPTQMLVDLAGGAAKYWTPSAQAQCWPDTTTPQEGRRCVRLVNPDRGEMVLSQTVMLDQTTPTPILAGGWSKALEATGAEDGNYSVYLDLLYTDGTPLFGQIANFQVGTHDWEYSEVVVRPEKPVKSLSFNVIFRYRTGTAWFDGLTLKQGEDPRQGAELLKNPGFKEIGSQGRLVDVARTGGKLTIPAYSGRVFLYGSGTVDELNKPGPRLRISTNPGLGEVRFRIDGFDYWTRCGMWTTEYVKGTQFGKFDIVFDGPGKHTVEIVDVVPADMQTPAGYSTGERLGQFMDPSQPTQPSGGKQFHFRRWSGLAQSTETALEVDVQGDCELTAEFEVTGGG